MLALLGVLLLFALSEIVEAAAGEVFSNVFPGTRDILNLSGTFSWGIPYPAYRFLSTSFTNVANPDETVPPLQIHDGIGDTFIPTAR